MSVDINKVKAIHKGWSGVDMDDAAALQTAVRLEELEQLRSGLEYSEERVRQCTVHTREDLILVVSRVGKIEREIRSIHGWVAVIGWLAIFAFLTGVVMLTGVVLLWKANGWWPF